MITQIFVFNCSTLTLSNRWYTPLPVSRLTFHYLPFLFYFPFSTSSSPVLLSQSTPSCPFLLFLSTPSCPVLLSLNYPLPSHFTFPFYPFPSCLTFSFYPFPFLYTFSLLPFPVFSSLFTISPQAFFFFNLIFFGLNYQNGNYVIIYMLGF